MKRLERPLGRALLVAACIAAGMTTVAATASAADDGIPRPPGAIDNRGYELVSQADKNGDQAGYVSPMSTTSDRVLYNVIGGVPGSTVGTRSTLFATRTANGWVSRNALPPFSELPGPFNLVTAVSPDLSHFVAASFEGGLGKTTTTPDSALVRLDDQAQPTLLHQFQTFFGAGGPEAVASDDTSHVLTTVPEPIDPTHQPGTANVYDVGSGTPVLVSVMPGTDAAPQCGVPFASSTVGFASSNLSAAEHWVSTDGRRAFFQTSGDNCGDPLQLYMRDLVARTTTLVSGPVVPGDTDNGVDRLLQATPDGSHVFYRTATSLDPADDADGNSNDMDIYEWSADTGQNVCLTCAVPNADVLSAAGGASNAVVSEDGSHVYFVSANQLADAPAPGTSDAPNLYLLKDGVVRYIATVDSIADRPSAGGEATPDGNVLIFTADRPELNALSGSDNGGLSEYYRYDDRDRSVTCISCPAGGTPNVPVPPGIMATSPSTIPAHDRILSDDGSIVFFATFDALVPQDVNQGPDIYEWHDGRVALITNGSTIYTANVMPLLAGTTSSGNDVFFEDTASLTPTVQDGAMKLYDARANGGFPPPPTPPAPCQGESCQGLPSGAPSLAGIGSLTFTGSGNLTSITARASFHAARVTAAQRARLARTGVLTLTVRVTAAGRVSALMQATLGRRVSVVARSARTAHGSGTVRLTLRLSHAARAQLARSGRLRVVLAVSYSRVRTAQRQSLLLHATSHGR